VLPLRVHAAVAEAEDGEPALDSVGDDSLGLGLTERALEEDVAGARVLYERALGRDDVLVEAERPLELQHVVMAASRREDDLHAEPPEAQDRRAVRLADDLVRPD